MSKKIHYRGKLVGDGLISSERDEGTVVHKWMFENLLMAEVADVRGEAHIHLFIPVY